MGEWIWNLGGTRIEGVKIIVGFDTDGVGDGAPTIWSRDFSIQSPWAFQLEFVGIGLMISEILPLKAIVWVLGLDIGIASSIIRGGLSGRDYGKVDGQNGNEDPRLF